ncbi:MAG: hypothetical protein ACI4JF_00235 [Oscillospiraceae bacterium]
MFEEVGIFYGIFIIMMYVIVLMDSVSIFMVFKKGQASITEYCTYGIKYPKVIVGLLFAVLVTVIILMQEFTLFVLLIQLLLAILLFVVEGLCLILKIKFGGKG